VAEGVRNIIVTVLLVALFVVVGVVSIALVRGTWMLTPVLSGSMRPGLGVGGIAVSERVPVQSLAVRDVIVFNRPDNPSEQVVHRIVQLSTNSSGQILINTQGDANKIRDPWTLKVRGSYIYQVRWSIPLLGYAAVFFQNYRGFILLSLGVVVLGLAFLYLPSRRQGRDAHRVRPVADVGNIDVLIAPDDARELVTHGADAMSRGTQPVVTPEQRGDTGGSTNGRAAADSTPGSGTDDWDRTGGAEHGQRAHPELPAPPPRPAAAVWVVPEVAVTPVAVPVDPVAPPMSLATSAAASEAPQGLAPSPPPAHTPRHRGPHVRSDDPPAGEVRATDGGADHRLTGEVRGAHIKADDPLAAAAWKTPVSEDEALAVEVRGAHVKLDEPLAGEVLAVPGREE